MYVRHLLENCVALLQVVGINDIRIILSRNIIRYGFVLAITIRNRD